MTNTKTITGTINNDNKNISFEMSQIGATIIIQVKPLTEENREAAYSLTEELYNLIERSIRKASQSQIN